MPIHYYCESAFLYSLVNSIHIVPALRRGNRNRVTAQERSIQNKISGRLTRFKLQRRRKSRYNKTKEWKWNRM